MIERLRALSPPLRYTAYVAGVIMLFFMAVGVGAAAGFVVGPQFRAPTGSVETGTFDGGKPERTDTTGVFEDTKPEPSSGSGAAKPSGQSDGPNDTASEVSFVHEATVENSLGDYTYISNPVIDGDADAVVLASPTSEREQGVARYEHNIGVWYEPLDRKWTIFNQDLAPVPAEYAFEVVVPQTSASFVHNADASTIAGQYTYLDNRLTNGQPGAVLAVTQNWNPGGGGGVYNDHPVGTRYDAQREKWAVYNKDGASMPSGAAFSIGVSADAD